ncbi:MAG: 1-deoxy-D-xylulose-5-phosphate reductoisomerase [Candidatus Gastranaerophilales bacterium]|nr:1-deoxy-D-xylulose-5-phosphate reductoisomerase [Candidatus Gastranaerophilales bacterium]
MKKRITILGSTGSIGTQTLEVLEKIKNKESFEIQGLACNSNLQKFIPQIEKFKPKRVCVFSNEAYKSLKEKYDKLEILYGEEGLIQIAADDTDILLTATTGNIALKPTLKAIENKIDIALANKETLVMAGDIVKAKAKANNVKILPVDSEHSAILQSSNGDFHFIKNILITASGGPFLNKTKEEIYLSRADEALKHPNWNMGRKITIDSATLMNKGLEVIEAHHLFDIPYDNIKVVIHPESIVHSAVEMIDGSVIAQLGNPSMHIPIQYALTYPKRTEGIETGSFSFFDKTLTFKTPDTDKFPCLKMAFEAGKKGGVYPAVLNAANECAVYKFLKGEIKLKGIIENVEKALSKARQIENPTLEEIFCADFEARKIVSGF